MLLNVIASIILAAMMLIPIVNVVVGAYVGVAIGGLLGGVSGVGLAVAIGIAETLIADRLGWRSSSSQVGTTGNVRLPEPIPGRIKIIEKYLAGRERRNGELRLRHSPLNRSLKSVAKPQHPIGI